jgi:hypothetical protein
MTININASTAIITRAVIAWASFSNNKKYFFLSLRSKLILIDVLQKNLA